MLHTGIKLPLNDHKFSTRECEYLKATSLNHEPLSGSMTLKNAVTFQWGFEESQIKGDQIAPRNKFLHIKSSSDERMSTHETPTANSVLHSPLSTVQGGQRLRHLPSKRFKGTLAARESVSHKPYATSSLWKPSDKGVADTSRKTFLTLTPVFNSSSVKKGQVQPKSSVVPLISMTPPLKVETLPHQPVPSDSRGEGVNGTAPLDLIHHNRVSETEGKERMHEEPQSNISFKGEEEQRDASGDKYDDHAFCHTHNDCAMIGHDNTFGNHSDFSKLSRLPAIKHWSHDPDKNDIETASLESYKPLPYEFENPWKSVAQQDNLHLTHELWENPKLLRKDTLLDSISDKNLIDQKTLFSKKVDASYSRITHENTVILPPVECNRRQRDVLSDSSFLTEKQYVRDVLQNQREVFHIHQKQDQVPETTIVPRRRSLELHVQEPEFVSQPKQLTKQTRSQNGTGAKDVRDFTHNKRNTLANERFFKTDAFFSSHLSSGNDILTSESDSLLHQSKAFNSRSILTEHLKKSPGLKRGINTNTGMQNEKARNRLFTKTACVDFKNGDIHDWKCSMAYTNTSTENPPSKQTQFRLPAKYPPHTNNSTEHTCPECRKGHRGSYSNRSVRENQHYSLPPQNSLFENQSHVSTHFCDVLGKHNCSKCREQKARKLRGQVNGPVVPEEKVTVAGLRRNGIMSPPPVPSPSPTFLPVQALHKVVIRVKDKQGVTSVTSVGVNEDVVRRTTA
ncbi:hypothetical protein PoB_006810400 [Plakobranchus ocellatus]|uniref:Uncharacterized protein n=1 Tax=Plakobranchus ocellatus TaxID=259542 RepID=A0AAV4DBM2_9GAST|nr:hypothetical protein PoB_006810400 [Plakobranchus ocellatus]